MPVLSPPVIVIAVLLTLTPGFAQQNAIDSATPPVLTLDEALKIATGQNKQAQISGFDVTKAREKVAETKTALFPQLHSYVLGGYELDKVTFTVPVGALGVYPATGPIPGKSIITTPAQFAAYIYAYAGQPIFEQIDNVPDGTPGQLPNQYSFNCQGKAGCQQPTGAAGGYSYQGVDGGNPPTQCAHVPWPEPMSDVDVIRIPGSQVAPVTQNVNQTFRKFLGPNSVWSNYQLISTQWPVAFNGGLLEESLLSDFNNKYPLNADCPFQVDHVANVTTETYEQGFSCIGCHYTAQTQNLSNTRIVSWTDFSMTLAFGGKSSAQVQNCTTGTPHTGSPRQPGMPKFHAAEHWQDLVRQTERGGIKP